MALSFKTNEFQETYKTLDELSKAGQLTPEIAREIVTQKGIDPVEFKKANKKFKAFKEQPNIKGLIERGFNPTEPTLLDQIFLAPTRAVGKAGEGLFNLGDAAARASLSEETYKTIKDTIDKVTPDRVKDIGSAITDPYHGEGIGGTTSKLTGDIGSYLIGGGATWKLGSTALNSGKISPQVARLLNKLSRAGRLGVKGGALGLAGAIGSTLVENPNQNSIDYLYAAISGNQEALDKLIEYQKNPDKPELNDYFDALLKNIAFEVPLTFGVMGLGTTLGALARKHSSKITSGVKTVETELGKAVSPVTKKIGKSKLGKKAKQYFSSRRGTDDVTLARVVERDAAANSALQLTNGYADDLLASIETNLKDKIIAEPDYIEYVINGALGGNKTQINRLAVDSPETLAIINEMRKEINVVQKGAANILGDNSKLAIKIKSDPSLKTWMLRSFEFYDNPEYAKKIRKRVEKRLTGQDVQGNIGDEVIDNVADYFSRHLGVSKNDPIVQQELESLVGVGTESSFLDFLEEIGNRNAVKSTGKPLYKRDNIPIEIRDLFGEVRDPIKNFAKSYQKLAVMNAENKFLSEMAVSLQKKFDDRVVEVMENNPELTREAAVNRVKNSMVDVSSVGSNALETVMGRKTLAKNQIKNPLQNVYADPEYKKLMEEGLNPQWNSKIINYFLAAKGTTQKIKTVYNPATHAKNVAGNFAMLGANGMLFSGEEKKQAIKTVLTSLGSKNNKELGKRMQLYSKLGITNSNLGLAEIKNNYRGIARDLDGWLERTTSGNTALSKIKKGEEWVTNAYQAEDDVFKIVHFEKTLEYLQDAYPQLEKEQLYQMAAQRTRDLMPNYNLVPTAVKALRILPVGDYMSFPFEMTRISKNLLKYTHDDLLSDNSILQKEAAKRLAGMTVVGTAPTIAMEGSKLVYDIDEDEHNAIELLGAPYEINTDRIYLSPINRDKNNHLGVDVRNIGSWDPFNYVKAAARNAHDMIIMGTDPERSKYEFNKTAIAAIDQTLGPFLGPSMITEGILNVVSGGRGYEPDTLEGYLEKGLESVLDLGDPFILKWLERRKNYEQTGMTDYYTTIPESSVSFPFSWIGLKDQRIDLTSGMRYNLNPEFNKVTKAQNAMNDVMKKPNITDPEKIMDSFKDVQKIRLDGFKNIRDVLELYQTLGLDIEDVINGISIDERRNIDKEKIDMMEAAQQNMFIPYMPKETLETEINKIPVPWDRMLKGYYMLEGKRLD